MLTAPLNEGGFVKFGSDVALLVLESPVEDVQPLKLFLGTIPSSRVGSKFTSIGFGVRDRERTLGERRMGKLTLQAVSLELHEGYEAYLGMGEGDMQPCSGDSGGPLVGKYNGALTVFGVVSGVRDPEWPSTMHGRVGRAGARILQRKRHLQQRWRAMNLSRGTR